MQRQLFRRVGDYWHVQWVGTPTFVRHSRGMTFVAHLLSAPGVHVHAADLVAIDRSRPRVCLGFEAQLSLRFGDGHEAHLDRRARAELLRRCDEIQQQLAEPATSARRVALLDELRFLRSELGHAVRGRHFVTESERARINVGRRVREALGNIATAAPCLGRHLDASIRTGTQCGYFPDHPLAQPWEL